MHKSLEHITGNGMTNQAVKQSSLPIKLGGLGIRSAKGSSDAAYITSSILTNDL